MTVHVRAQLGDALAARRGSVGNRRVVTALLQRAARAVLEEQNVSTAELSITLLDDAAIAGMNEQFLSHAGPTDVISFALHEDGEPVVGDIYIGYEQAVRQASAADVPLDEELARLAVHGTLHVLGFDHPDGTARHDSRMWKLQERIVGGVMRA